MYPEQNGELPAIATTEAAARQQVTELMGPAPEELRNSPGPSMPANASTATIAMPAPAIAPPVQVGEPAATTPQATGTPAMADDVDLIEKEWVDKAKQIIEMTRNEPFEQKKEMSQLKADYLQKRYNKSVKVDSTPSGS